MSVIRTENGPSPGPGFSAIQKLSSVCTRPRQPSAVSSSKLAIGLPWSMAWICSHQRDDPVLTRTAMGWATGGSRTRGELTGISPASRGRRAGERGTGQVDVAPRAFGALVGDQPPDGPARPGHVQVAATRVGRAVLDVGQ